MKKIFFFSAVLFLFSIPSMAQGIFNKVNNAIKKDSVIINKVSEISKTTISKSEGSNLSEDEIIRGLKEALTIGAKNSVKTLSAYDGFFKNEIIKIVMPTEAQKVEKTLRKFGLGSLVDEAIVSMNRAAEDAATGVDTIFFNAIKNITIKDGLSILKGGDTAATAFLKGQTTAQLTEKIKPVIEASLKKVDATKYWSDVFSNYNKISRQKINPDLNAYVTEKAIAGLFYTIEQEEKKIRKDPAAQVTDLLKKVFGK